MNGHIVRPQIFLKATILLGILALLAALTINVQTASAHLPIAEDDGEDDGQAWSGLGWLSDWEFRNSYFTFFNDPHEGWWHLRIKESGYAIRNVDVSGAENLHLQLWAKARDLETGSAFIEISDDGDSYTVLKTWDSSNDDDVYSSYDFDLTELGLDLSAEVWVRFRVTGSGHDGDLFIDEIEIASVDIDPDETPPVDPDSPITIDGKFEDWEGKAFLADTIGDQDGGSHHDIATLYWANNIDGEVNYQMIERRTTDEKPFDGSNGQSKSSNYILYVDTNNDGDVTDSDDRHVQVTYSPKNHTGKVRVKVYSATSSTKISDTGWKDTGESRTEGGLRFEFAVDWDDLGIDFGEVIRMHLIEYEGSKNNPDVDDRLPNTGDIQWSPASILGPWLLAGAMILGILVIWQLKGRRLWT